MRQDALRQHAQIAGLIASMFRPALGPRGLAKLVENDEGLWLSDSAALVLEKAAVKHPAAKIIAEAAAALHRELGEGSSTAVVLIGALVKSAEHLSRRGVHPNVIVHGWRLALDHCLTHAPSLPIDRRDDRGLTAVARAALSPTLRSIEVDYLGRLVVQAVLQVAEPSAVDVDSIAVEREPGQGIRDTILVQGIALRHEVGDPAGPTSMPEARIALVKGEILAKPPENWRAATRIEVTKPAGMRAVRAFAEGHVRALADIVIGAGANVLMLEKGADAVALSHLSQRRILVVRRVVIETLERIGKATGGRVVTHLADLSPKDLGHAQLVHERFVGAKRWIFIEGCSDPKALTLLCRGYADFPGLDPLPKLLRQALKTVRAAYLLPQVVAGGGAFEAQLAHLVRQLAYQLGGREQLAALTFADALDIVPFSLAENAGRDALGTLLELRARHAAGGVWSGVDAAGRAIADMHTGQVYEPLSIKLRVLQSAYEIASLLTRTGAYVIQRQVAGKQARLLEERKKHLAPERVKKIHKEHFSELAQSGLT